MKKIKAGSHKITNEVIFNLIKPYLKKGHRILDFGAGSGYMCQKIGNYLLENGLNPEEIIFACDISPENFQYSLITCSQTSPDSVIPFPDETFNVIYAIKL